MAVWFLACSTVAADAALLLQIAVAALQLWTLALQVVELLCSTELSFLEFVVALAD